MNIISRLIIPLIFVLVFPLTLLAQSEDTLSTIIQDGWIQKTNDMIGFDLSLNNSFETFEVHTSTNKILLSPNKTTYCGVKLNYKTVSVAVQFAPKFIPGNEDDDIKGKTKTFIFGLLLNFRHWFTDLSYSKVEGYYLENTDEYLPWQDGDPYIQFPDLSYHGIAFTTGYVRNARFSFPSLISQTERQLKSAGSFIPVVNLRYYTIDNQSSGATSQKSNNFESSLGPGYIYTFVAKEKFYASLGIISSFGYLNTKLTTRLPTEDIITNQDNFVFQWDAKLGLGYNGNYFYSGLYTTLSGTHYQQENTSVRNIHKRLYYHLFVGFRLQAPEFMKRKNSKIED